MDQAQTQRAMRIPLYEGFNRFCFHANYIMQTVTRALTIVALVLLISLLTLAKSCMTPQQLPAGIGQAPEAPAAPSRPIHNSTKEISL